MMGSNHRIVLNGDDWMRDMERRVGRQERRPVPVNVKDQFGPGISQRARQIVDWNDPEMLRNGWYYGEELSINSPDPLLKWLGMTVVTFAGHGVQRLWSHGGTVTREAMREAHWHPGDLLPTFTDWAYVNAGPTRFASGKTATFTATTGLSIPLPAGRFTAPPSVSVTPVQAGANVPIVANTTSVTATGFTVLLYGVGGAWSSGLISLDWQAIQPE